MIILGLLKLRMDSSSEISSQLKFLFIHWSLKGFRVHRDQQGVEDRQLRS